MKGRSSIRFFVVWIVVLLITIFDSCSGGSYKDLPFGGMNGRVQKVTVVHRMPEMWRVNERGVDVMNIDALVYDINGFEICSALMDSTGRVESEAESMFDNGVCVRSIQKSDGKVVARLNLISRNKNTLEYSKNIDGNIGHMTVQKSSSFRRKSKTVVIEDGKITTIIVTQADRHGYPVRILETNPQTGSEILQVNVYDDKHNIIEKHVSIKGEEKEEIIYTDYLSFDEQGNWTEARTYNRNHLPVEILVRKIEYWD